MLTAREEAADKHWVLWTDTPSKAIVECTAEISEYVQSIWMNTSDFLDFAASNRDPFDRTTHLVQIQNQIGGSLFGVTVRFSENVPRGILIFCEEFEDRPIYHVRRGDPCPGRLSECSSPDCVARSVTES